MEKIFDKIVKVLDKVIGVFLIVIVVVTFLQVLFRYFVNKPLMWTEELARASGIWMVMVGAALAQKDNKHIGMEILPEKISWITPWLTEIVVLAFTCLLLKPRVSVLCRLLRSESIFDADSHEFIFRGDACRNHPAADSLGGENHSEDKPDTDKGIEICFYF